MESRDFRGTSHVLSFVTWLIHFGRSVYSGLRWKRHNKYCYHK